MSQCCTLDTFAILCDFDIVDIVDIVDIETIYATIEAISKNLATESFPDNH